MYDTVPLLATTHSTGQYRKTMDKKSKKKIDVLRKRIEKMQRALIAKGIVTEKELSL